MRFQVWILTDAIAWVTEGIISVTDVMAWLTDAIVWLSDAVAWQTDAIVSLSDAIASVSDVIALVSDVIVYQLYSTFDPDIFPEKELAFIRKIIFVINLCNNVIGHVIVSNWFAEFSH